MTAHHGAHRELGSADEIRAGTDLSLDEDPPFDYQAAGLDPDGAIADLNAPRAAPLVALDLSNDLTIEFFDVEDPESPGLAVREVGDTERMTPSILALMNRSSIRNIYEALVATGPIPRAIAASSTGPVERDVVETIDDNIEVDLDATKFFDRISEITQQPSPLGAGRYPGHGQGGKFCVPGDGFHAFQAFACGWSGGANVAPWCDPGAEYYWRDRRAPGGRKNSFGIVATCHGPAYVLHYRRKANKKWKVQWDPGPVASSYWAATRYEGAIKFGRGVRHGSQIQGPPSFVRSFIAVYD